MEITTKSSARLLTLLRLFNTEMQASLHLCGNRLGDIRKLLVEIADESARLGLTSPVRLERTNLIIERTPLHDASTIWGVELDSRGAPYRLPSTSDGHKQLIIAKVQNWIDYITMSENSDPPKRAPSLVGSNEKMHQDLWDYAKMNWAPSTDKYLLAESIKTGPTNYRDCVDKLVPNVVDKSVKSKRFHAVMGPMNRTLREKFGFEVFRKKEQFFIRPWTKPEPSKKKVPKKSTKRKT